MGQMVAEYSTPTQQQAGTGGTSYLTADNLGTPRIITGADGTVKGRHDYLPFGEEIAANYGNRNSVTDGHPLVPSYEANDNLKQKFTGKERDNETGLDYFGARYYYNEQGRFTSTDPSWASEALINPQSWNRYTYCYNIPLAYMDHNGKWPTPIHNQIIKEAFPGLSVHQLKILMSASHKMDVCVSCQTTKNAYKHGMKAPGQSNEDAIELTDNFVASREEEAETLQSNYAASGGTGISDKALKEFGKALHTITDELSPTHRDSDGNPLKWEGVTHLLATKKHVAGESKITPEQLQKATDAAKQAFLKTFGEELYNIATQQRSAIGTESDVNVQNIHQSFIFSDDPVAEGLALHEYRLRANRNMR